MAIELTSECLLACVELALKEDLDSDSLDLQADLTTASLVDDAQRCRAQIVARQSGTIAGTAVAEAVFRRLDPAITCEVLIADGFAVDAESTVMTVAGKTSAVLTGERTALNFLQHLSGIATCTRTHVDAIAGRGRARITDTRKTTPGLRLLEKYAVTQGGGVSHRMGLFDAVLIKENHAAECGGVAAAVSKVRREVCAAGASPPAVMVEARLSAEVEALLGLEAAERPDRILLDNMQPAALLEAVQRIRASAPEIVIEATGGITLDTVGAVAAAGVDVISVGALTHSAPALDLSLLVDSLA